jgi:Rrf2 family nitric oxide-sensitive transcriptional repressor
MQLTRFTDYSLRILIYLALNDDRLVTIAEIARSYDVSQNHLMKIVHQLGGHGYLETVRGKGGGIRLARQAALINIGDVVRDTEEHMDIVECFSLEFKDCPLLPSCALKSILTDARKNFLATLDRYNLSDLLPTGRAVIAFKSRTGDRNRSV